MPELRSRNIAPAVDLKNMPENVANGCFEPSTPVKTPETLNQQSNNSTPSSILSGTGGETKELDSGSGGKSIPWSAPVWRRSLRLAAKSGVGQSGIAESVDLSRPKRKKVDSEVVEDLANGCKLKDVENERADDGESTISYLNMKKVRVPEEVDVDIHCLEGRAAIPAEANVRLPGSMIPPRQNGCRLESEGNGKGKRKSGIEVDLLGLKCAGVNDSERKFLNLRSGKRVSKRVMAEGKSGSTEEESLVEVKMLHDDVGEIVVSAENEFSKVSKTNVDDAGLCKDMKSCTGEVKYRGEVVEEAGGSLELEVDMLESTIASTDLGICHSVENTGIKKDDNLGTTRGYTRGVKTRSTLRRSGQVKQRVVDNDKIPHDFDALDQKLQYGTGKSSNIGVKTRSRLNRSDKLKERVVDKNNSDASDVSEQVHRAVTTENGVKTRSRLSRSDKGKEKDVDNDKNDKSIDSCDANETGAKARRRLSREDKGKGKIVESDYSYHGSDAMEGKPELTAVESNQSEATRSVENVALQEENTVTSERRIIKERFRDLAKQNAARFAHFTSEEEVNHAADVAARESSPSEEGGKIEDWPGPFSTAMKIIKDREINANVQQQNASVAKNKAPPKWVPKRDQEFYCQRRSVPSLQDLCWPVLVNNADAISSLDCIPDVLKHKLSQLLCDHRRMNSHTLELLVRGSPTEIRVRECSWLTEETFMRTFQGRDTSNLMVLQLDYSGCCLPDYILSTTLAHSPICLPSLTTISLKGAYRLTDAGLRTLVTSAPSLRSVNLSQCSLLTSDGISVLADSLGSVLRELNIEECQGINVMLILPALVKLQNLEVLSIAGIESVSDYFVTKLVSAHGQHLKELFLKDCLKLTDSSVKVIAENCPGLCAIDLSNLRKLTDAALGYLANGCRAIHTLKLGRNLFSDEAVAAYVVICGDSLKELSLNYVTKVADNTAVSLAKCSKNLHTLDLSFCRSLSNEDLGLILDSCISLKVLKLFGCTQVTNVLLCGHSNPQVKIIGIKMTPVLQHLKDGLH